MNKVSFTIIIFFFSTVICLSAQQNNEFWDHVRFGGGIGLSFGDGFFSGTLAPSAIYEIDQNFAIGLGLNGTINNQKNVYKSTILGGSIIGLFNVINEIQLSSEFEQLHVKRNYDESLNIENDTYWSPALFIGAGYRSGNVTFGLRYDLLYDKEKSIYIDPWAPFVRFYF
ncbi:alpha-ketoglutarate decarboxylase [Changchengzhania lutea]|uniref:alpha-ketoglutarate decarboxylase n=1 Tax=Changchengzhania lutea TaxID=2049305 RepID=UPI00115D146A|nr:alpha-ketoglutarate decarboxylase [Changchengzhania lutea]